MPSHTTFISATLAQAQAQAQPAPDPDAALGQRMGGIAFVCLLAALVVAVVMKAAKGMKK